MRITNKMITNNASGNINGNKVLVDKTNTQMTTQKKIARPSENPVIAIRSLRLQTTLNKVNQYYEKNIPDAESWMDVTETALTNIKDLITSMRTLCVNGSTGTLTEKDRDTILTQLKALQSQVYAEGNADYAGRTVFTGYRTDKTLTFTEDESLTRYDISETNEADSFYRKSYYTKELDIPVTKDDLINDTTANPNALDVEKTDYYVMRMAYDSIGASSKLSFKVGNATEDIDIAGTASQQPVPGGTNNYALSTVTTATLANPTPIYQFENEDDWAAVMSGKKEVPDDGIVIVKSTGEVVMGENVATTLMNNDVKITLDYEKTGFKEGELRPEYYFNCTQYTDKTGAQTSPSGNGIKFDRFDATTGDAIKYEIQYTVSQNQELTVNMEANECFDHNIYQDMGDMLEIVHRSVPAHNRLDKIKTMMASDEYSSEECQAKLNVWLDLAQKECDYADDNMQKSYSRILGNVDGYLEDINLSITKMGCRGDQLAITKTRMNNQQQTVEELQSTNDDMDLSDIIIKYTAAYTAYQSSLTAAGKLGQQTLLNYI